ncbi:MAG: SpoIIE family protein phosphatase [Anaerolineae bacterium]|nr:SpoIIE family protein phosphatase [Anaerolineae bacterium]
MMTYLGRDKLKKWTENGAVVLVWLVLVFVLLFSLANLFVYLLVPVDGSTIAVREEPIQVLGIASIEPGGLRQGDVILAIQDHDLDWWLDQRWRTLPGIIQRLNHSRPITEITVGRNGETQPLLVPLGRSPLGPPGRQFLIHFVVGAAFLIAGWVILKARGRDLVGRVAALVMLLMALIEQNEIPPVLGAELGWSLLWLFIPLRLLTRWFTYSYVLVFSFSFPQPKAWLKRWPYVTLPLHLLNPVVTLAVIMSVDGNLHHCHTVAYPWSKAIYSVYLLLACAVLVHTYFTTRGVVPKNQLRWIAWGAVMATLPNVLLMDLPYLLFGLRLLPQEISSLLLLFVPFSVAVAILRYRLWNIELIIKASLVYAALTIVLGIVYLALVFTFVGLLGQSSVVASGTGNASVFFVSALVVAFLFTPLRDYVQRFIDRLFYRNKLNYAAILAQLSRDLATSLLLNDWLQLLTQTIPTRLNLKSGRVILDALPPQNSPEYHRLKQGRLVWLHGSGSERLYPSPLHRLQQAGMWCCAPLLSGDKLVGLYGLGPKRSGEYYQREEINLIETLARQAGVSLENAQLHEKLATQARAQRDLEIARRIQLSLLPAADPVLAGVEIVGFSMPAEEVGGDFYHYLKFDDRRVGIAVGDVSGKGVSAALFMAVTVSSLQAKSPHHLRAPELLAEMNRLLHAQLKGGVNTALLYTIIQHQPGQGLNFSASNAGLISPLLRRQGDCQYIDVSGLPLGVLAEVKYRAYQFDLQPGDLILLCSDGVVEAMNPRREMFGFERLEQFMAGCDGLPAAEVVLQLKNAVTAFVGGAKQHDDMTMVVLRVM